MLYATHNFVRLRDCHFPVHTNMYVDSVIVSDAPCLEVVRIADARLLGDGGENVALYLVWKRFF